MLESQFSILKEEWVREKKGREESMKESAENAQALMIERRGVEEMRHKMKYMEEEVMQRKQECEGYMKQHLEASYKMVSSI